MRDYDFITDSALRSNIKQANELILEIVLLTSSRGYQERKTLVSSLRKTVIIYVATIVEALLLWKLKEICHTGEVELDDEWEFKDPRKIYNLTDTEDIVWCRRKRVKKKIDQLDFLHVTRCCIKHTILRGKILIKDVNTIREYRNRLHIGGLTEIDREYKPEDLEFCFSVLNRVNKQISNI